MRQRKLAQGINQSAAFGNGDESIRRQRAFRTSRPAQQGLYAFHHQRFGIDDRLIPDIKFAFFETFADTIFNVQLVLTRFVKGVIIPGRSSLTAFLRVVHGHIRTAKQLSTGTLRRHPAGNTNTGADIYFPGAERNGSF